MRNPDRAPGVHLVTDHPGARLDTRRADELEPGHYIAVGFGGYGRVIARVERITTRDVNGQQFVDIDVAAPGLDYTTMRAADARDRLYDRTQYGQWL
jgi:hypothetical protein